MRTHEYCAICGEELEAEYVDVGIGFQQVTEADCPRGCIDE
ncbi:hypothetical protein [Salibacterium lacus]|uniref:CPXCG motif-containing cysteine-rich protein n=1 Tax=Salibacterium lacus TaxID=1898109 RepID=A0ABW5SYM1_9BACI